MATILLDTGFDGADWDDGFEQYGPTNWNPDNQQYVSAPFSALATKNDGGDLITDDLDCSDASQIDISFWYRMDRVLSNQFLLYYWNGSSYDQIFDLDGAEETWYNYTDTIYDSQYFISDFHIRINTALSDKNGKAWMDDFYITKETGGGGYANNVLGIGTASISKVFNVETANISKVYKI